MPRSFLRFFPIFLCALLCIGSLARAGAASIENKASARFKFDRQCVTIDGKDIFLFSGAFHYFRCPQPLWRDRFQKMREAGLNTVETYVPWNYHERTMPAYVGDFSKLDFSELEAWLQMAEEEGFYVIIRPGPHSCAELESGGFPRWLGALRPADYGFPLWFRGDEATFQKWCSHWMRAVVQAIAPHQIHLRPAGQTGVIMFQVENEYSSADVTEQGKLNSLRNLVQSTLDAGLEIPIFTCQTRSPAYRADPLLGKHVLETANMYPFFAVEVGRTILKELADYQPDAFRMITECQGGWFGKIGEKSSEDWGFDAEQLNAITVLAMEQGVTAINYYMFAGGTNFDSWGGKGIVTSYDYDAPLREWGGRGPRYAVVQGLGTMLKEHGARLARAEPVELTQVDATDPDVTVAMRRAKDGSAFIFVRTEQNEGPRKGTIRFGEGDTGKRWALEYELGRLGAKIFFLPASAKDIKEAQWIGAPAPEPQRPAVVAPGITLTQAAFKGDSGAKQWRDTHPGQNLDEAGVLYPQFVQYRIPVEASAAQAASAATCLVVSQFGPEDSSIKLGDTIIQPLPRTSPFEPSVFPLKGALVKGKNEVILTLEMQSYAHVGHDLDMPKGLERVSVRELGKTFIPVESWKYKVLEPTADLDERALLERAAPELTAEINAADTAWLPVVIANPQLEALNTGKCSVFRASVELTTASLKAGATRLSLHMVDDLGYVYVNGKEVGRTNDWRRMFSFDAKDALRVGRNEIAVVVKRVDVTGASFAGSFIDQMPETAAKAKSGDKAAEKAAAQRVAESQDLAKGWELATDLEGQRESWFAPVFKDTKWQTIPLQRGKNARATPAPQDSLVWYRAHFKLPAQPAGVWVPWRLRLAAAGNGFIYFNGHNIGHWWEGGPQTDYYLPECWLNFGPHADNVITILLRPTRAGAILDSAQILPYAEFAEVRN